MSDVLLDSTPQVFSLQYVFLNDRNSKNQPHSLHPEYFPIFKNPWRACTCNSRKIRPDKRVDNLWVEWSGVHKHQNSWHNDSISDDTRSFVCQPAVGYIRLLLGRQGLTWTSISSKTGYRTLVEGRERSQSRPLTHYRINWWIRPGFVAQLHAWGS